MNGDIQQVIAGLMDGAAGTIIWEVAVRAALGALVAVLSVLVFRFVTSMLLGDPRGKWAGTWHAVWILAMVTVPAAGATIGGGEGLVRGCERALRESEFGSKMLPAITEQSVFMYGAIYYADPETLQNGNLTDVANLKSLTEVREFADGNRRLNTARLNERMQGFKGAQLAELARSARQDFQALTPALEDDFPGLKSAADLVTKFALPPDVDQKVSDGAVAPLFDVESAAALQGDPDTITRDELLEHLRERVAIPGLLAPIKVAVRPWQIAAWIYLGLMFLFLVTVRAIVWRNGGMHEELANEAESN